jgi:hypothetical protein
MRNDDRITHCVYCYNLITFIDGFWRSQGYTVTCPARTGQGHVAPHSRQALRAQMGTLEPVE